MASGSWLLTTDGAWNNNANWSAAFPNALTDTATFATDITGTTTVTMGQAISVGSMTFSDNGAAGSAWAIAPGGAFALTLGTSTITTTTDATISASVSGTAAVTKSGNATLTLTGGGANTGAWAVNAGTLAVTTANLTGTSGVITVAPGATLTTSASVAKPLTVNGTATVNSGGALTGQQIYAAAAGSVAKVTIASGGSITHPANKWDISTSTTGRTAVYQNGNVSATGASSVYGISLGFGAATTAYGYWYGKSGTLTTTAGPYLLVGLSYSSGTTLPGGAPSVMDIDGATLNIGARFFIGNSIASSAAVHILQGTHTQGNASSLNLGGSELSGNTNITSGSSQQRLTIKGASTSFTSTAPLYMTANSATALTQINVVDGAAFTIAGGITSNATPKQINLINGSTFNSTSTFTTSGGAFTLTLYGNGNKIGSGSSTGEIVSIIQNATGSGVASIPITPGNEGSGYIGAPVVVLTGGGGTGASARAVWDEATQKITSFEITNPGTGYTSAPTVVLSGATLANSACTTEVIPGTVTLAANSTDGAVEKIGTGETRLTGTNTNTGAYTVSTGTLAIGNSATAGSGKLGASNASDVVLTLSTSELKFNRGTTGGETETYSGIISGAGRIARAAANGTSVLTGDNTFTGTVTLNANSGTIRAAHSNALGLGAGAVVVNSSSALELSNNITITRGASIAGTGISSNGALRNNSGSNTISGPITLTAAASIGSDSGTLSLTSGSAISGSFALTFVGADTVDVTSAISNGSAGIVKGSGAGAAILRGTSSYTGVNTISAGRLGYVGSIAPSTAGNFGNASLAANILIAANAGVRYYGSGSATFSRAYTFQGGATTANYLESNGVGAVTHSLAPTYATANVTKTLGLGGTGTADNTISYVIANNGTGAVSVTKADAGKWVASQNNTATGAYAVNGGTLILQGTNTPASVAVSNSNTVLGLEIATWAAGTRRVGTATVTVNANAKIQTFNGSGAAPQNGRHTYTNLTFAANSRIRIGG
jgi:autotransporter-associated beta strand protein